MNGFLLLDKPYGLSSAHALNRLKRQLPRGTKLGHGGTLDPLATGLLVVALGEATKLLRFVTDAPKEYTFTITFGEERSTDDAEGEPTIQSPARPTPAELVAKLPQFLGDIAQIPPAYSAIKIAGERAYARARAGEDVTMPSRQVQIHGLALLETTPDTAHLWTHCGKGTYVRSLARDLARAVGCHGYVSTLRRTRIGAFSTNHAISLENEPQTTYKADPLPLISLEGALDDIPALHLTSELTARFRQGQTLVMEAQAPIGEVVVFHENRCTGIGVWDGQRLKPERLINA